MILLFQRLLAVLAATESPCLEAELETLLSDYAGLIRRLVRQACGSSYSDLGEDVEQEIRIATFRFLESGKSIENPYSFFVKVSTRIALRMLDKARRLSHQREQEVGDAEPVLEATADRSQVDPERAEIHRQLVQRGLDTLSERRREAVKAYLRGLNHVEVARIMGWTEPAARSAIYDGLKSLREFLEDNDAAEVLR